MPLSKDEIASLQRQLKEARANLQLINERKAEFVLGVEVPLQLIREEQRLKEHIRELESTLAASTLDTSRGTNTTAKPPVRRSGRQMKIEIVVALSLLVISIIGLSIATTGLVLPVVGTLSPTLTLTTAPSLTPTFTSTPAPDPRAELKHLINTEATAVVAHNLNLLATLYMSTATKTDASSGVSGLVLSEYARSFSNEQYQSISHTNFQFDINGDTATVINDSCGLLHLNRENIDLPFNCPQCDRWRFQRDATGRWWITDFTYNLPDTATQHLYPFEEEAAGCWVARMDNNVPQGSDPSFTQESVHQGMGALRLALDLTSSVPRSQIVRWHMPFSGQAEAYVYASPDAPTDLSAGFFAMDFDHEPWNYHPADQMIPLKPGAWTRVTWDVTPAGWAQPQYLLGLEVRRANNELYRGYVLIDDIVIQSR